MKPVISVGRIVPKSQKCPTGWENEIPSVDRPILLCLGGTGSDKEEKSVGFANFIASLLTNSSSVDVYGVMYQNYSQELFSQERLSYLLSNGEMKPQLFPHFKNKAEYRDCPEIKVLFNQIFQPLLIRKNGRAYSKNEIQHHLRRVNLVGYSYGSFVATKLEEMIDDTLKQIGYSKENRRDCLQELFILTIAPRTLLNQSDAFKVQCVSQKDSMLGANMKSQSLPVYLKNLSSLKDELFVLPSSKNERILCVPAVTEEKTDEHHISPYFVTDKPTSAGKILNKTVRVLLELAVYNSVVNFNREKSGKSVASLLPVRLFLDGKLKTFPDKELVHHLQNAADKGKRFLMNFQHQKMPLALLNEEIQWR